MKKAMKLVWMVLFALPLISLTACGDDDLENEDGATVNLKDYSDLLDKTQKDVMNKMDMDVTDQDQYGLYYENVDKNVEEVDVFYTFFEENEYGAIVTYDKSVMVEVDLKGFTYDDVYNFCSSKYGKGEMYDGMLVIKKGDMYVWYEYNNDGTAELTFVKKSEWDKVYGEIKTKGGEFNAFKATKERARAHRAL